MSNISVCVRFRPLSSKERKEHGGSVCIRKIDDECFLIKDEKDGDFTFSFDKVFYDGSDQASVYEFLALPIVQDAVNGINGTIITYGQTGAGKTYSMEGSGILDTDEGRKGLIPRVLDGLFKIMKSSHEASMYSIKVSMVEIYMEKVRDLFDLSKDNIQIKESKLQGILLNGVTEIPVLDPEEALQNLSHGIANRAVGETQMNMASSRSHSIYIFTVQQDLSPGRRTKTGKLILVDLAGSEKAEKTGAEGKVLEEAKTINKSLSALGNVVNALTSGAQGKAGHSLQEKTSHIPYRDSKLTRILQDALGGNSRTALLCCCSPSHSNASETLSTLRFGARAKHIKASPRVNHDEDKSKKQHEVGSDNINEPTKRILSKVRERLNIKDVEFLEELFVQEGVAFVPTSSEELESAREVVTTARTISSLRQSVEELVFKATKLDREIGIIRRENSILKARLSSAAGTSCQLCTRTSGNTSVRDMLSKMWAVFPGLSTSQLQGH